MSDKDELCPPKEILKPQSLVCMNMTLCGNRVFVDVIKLKGSH
jgi:hypothetical protein